MRRKYTSENPVEKQKIERERWAKAKNNETSASGSEWLHLRKKRRRPYALRRLCWRCGRGSRRFGAAVFHAMNAGRSPNPAALCRDGGAVFSCAFYKWQAVAASCGKDLSKHEKMRANLRKSASLACNKRGMIVLLNMYVKSISAAMRSGGIKRRKAKAEACRNSGPLVNEERGSIYCVEYDRLRTGQGRVERPGHYGGDQERELPLF